MDTLCNSLNSSVVTHNPLPQLLILQVLNVLKKDTIINNNIDKYCMEIYNIVNDETLAIHELNLENINIKTELATSNTNIEELKTAIEMLKAYDKALNNQVLHIKDENLEPKDDWRNDYYADRKTTFDSRIESNNGRLSKFEDNMLRIINSISSSIQDETAESESVTKLKENLKESQNYIKELKLLGDEFNSIYSALFSEIKDVYKVSKAFKYNYDKINTEQLAQKFPKTTDIVIEQLKLTLNESEVNLMKCKKEADAGKLIKNQEALNEVLYLYYKYDDNLTGLDRALVTCDMNEVKLLLDHGFADSKMKQSQLGNTHMHIAAQYGCTDILTWIASKNSSLVNKKNKQGQTPLHLSVQNKHLDTTLKLIQKGANINAISNYQGTPLHIAAQNGDEEVAKVLINKKATVDATSQDSYTPLHIAVENDQLTVARLLVDKKAKVNALTKRKFTPLHISAKNGNLEMARLLLQHSANLDAKSNGDCIPLHVALNYGKTETAKLIINVTANKMQHEFIFEDLFTNSCKEIEDTNLFRSRVIGLQDMYIPNKEERLFKAVRANNISLTRALLNIGTNPSPKDAGWYQGTPLLWATSQGFLEVVKLLLKAGAKTNERDTDGFTALHWAVDKSHVELTKLLLEHGASTEVYDGSNRTPLQSAVLMGNIPITTLLLSKGANTAVRNPRLRTPLHIAAFAGHTKVVELLVDAGAQLNAQDDGGNTALHYAAYLGHFDICVILISKGAPLETTDSFGRTPLHHAASQGHLSIIKLLLQSGAQYVRDSSFNTPADLASLNNKNDVADWLETYMNG